MVDLGVGDGLTLLATIRQLFRSLRLKKIRGVLVDQSVEILTIASERCRAIGPRFCATTVASRRVQDLELPQLLDEPAWLINAAGCLHHLNSSEKRAVLERLSNRGRFLLLTEIEGNHDIERLDALNLADAVFHFYDALISDVLESPMSAKLRDRCVLGFLLPEALTLVSNDYANRANFHTTEANWVKLAGSAAWRHVLSLRTPICGHKLTSSTMLFRSMILS